MYMPRKDFGRGPGPFNVEHANLELSNFTFRAIDYGARHRVGNIFNNIFVANHGITKPVDCIIRFDGDSCNVSMSHITLMSTCCRNAAISLNCVRGFHISTLHIENIGLTENGHGLKEWKAVTENDYISGQFLWTGIDYLGEAHGWPIHGSSAGLLTLAGFPKNRYYRRQSFWLDAPVLHLSTARYTGDVTEYLHASDCWNYEDGEQILEPEKPDRHLFSDFVLELSGGRPALVSDRETLELTRACLLAREAADTGTKILF